MDRVFICGYYNFPRGGAAANYVQYFGSAIRDTGKNVICISNICQENVDGTSSAEFNGIKIIAISLGSGKIAHYVDFNYRLGILIESKLREQKVDAGDIVIAYSRDPGVLKRILSICKKCGAKSGVCLVEWFDRHDMSSNRSYRQFKRSFELNKKFDFIIPISTYIEKHYKEAGCNTLRVPCLTDTLEYDYLPKSIKDKKMFVYPANGKIKDALTQMITAICSLDRTYIEKAEFHITGVKQNIIEDLLKGLNKQDLLNSTVFVHGWMEYKELVSIYQKAHFILLARARSRMTEANFPSKIPECLTYGIIPVCSRVGDYTSLYLNDGDNAIVFEGCNSETIARAICRAIDLDRDNQKVLSDNCRKTAETMFDYRVWTELLGEFLQRI